MEHRDSRPLENGMVGVKNPAVHKHLTSLTVSVIFEVTSGLSIIMTALLVWVTYHGNG